MPQTDGDHQKLLTEVIKKQIVILGPDITLAKARNVEGLTVSDDGTVTGLSGDPAVITQKLVEQFMELSGLIVKKTMEPLLANYPKDGAIPQPQVPPIQPQVETTPVNPLPVQPQNPPIENVQAEVTTQTIPENQGTGGNF